jgi:hypothetical protein
MPPAAGRGADCPLGQLCGELRLIGEPRIVTAVDVDDDQIRGRQADIGGGVQRPPAIDLVEVGGSITEPMFGQWVLDPGAQGKTAKPRSANCSAASCSWLIARSLPARFSHW